MRQKALELLARREHSRLELKQKLIIRGFPIAEIDSLLFDLARTGLQSDQRFTEAYLHWRCAVGYGPKQIASELRQRGIVDLPEVVLDEENEFWRQHLVQLWHKKYTQLPQDLKEYARQMRFLLCRGFSATQVRQLLKR